MKKVKNCEKIGNVGVKIEWKAVMERPAGAELRIRRQANKTGERDAQENLTRRRGAAEEVREGLKFLCDHCVLCGFKICTTERAKRPTGAGIGRRAAARIGSPAIGGG